MKLFGSALRRLEAECYLIERGGCDGRLQSHHVYPKRVLKALAKREGLQADRLVADARNGVLLCERHHHRVEYGLERFDRGDMPTRLSAFELDYPFVEAWWPRIYQPGRYADLVEGVIP